MAITKEKAEQIAQCFADTGFLNKTQSLIKAGYKQSYARSRGQELYDNKCVKKAIKAIKDK